MGRKSIYEERTKLRVGFGSLCVLLIGMGLLLVSEKVPTGHEVWKSLLRELGAVVAVSVLLHLVWEWWGKRTTLEEFLSKIKGALEAENAGIRQVARSFQDVDFKSLFHGSKTLRLFVSYAHTWRNSHLTELRGLVDGGGTVEVILPNPDSAEVVRTLADRFNMSEADVKEKIRTAAKDFKCLAGSRQHERVTVYYVPVVPVFSAYLFDTDGVYSLYSHRREREPVPTYVVRRDGQQYDFLKQELDDLVRRGAVAVIPG